MNREGRDVLVQAALRGHRQIYGHYHDHWAADGECAIGVLHLTLHKNRKETLACQIAGGFRCYQDLCTRYSLSNEDVERIVVMNDQRFDFLTIARKLEEPTKEGANDGPGTLDT